MPTSTRSRATSATSRPRRSTWGSPRSSIGSGSIRGTDPQVPFLSPLSLSRANGVGREVLALAHVLAGTLGFEPGCSFGFLRGLGGGLFIGGPLGAQLLDQPFAIA